MTKQSSKLKVRRSARHYLLDCHAALAMTGVLEVPSKQDAARTQSAGDTRAGTD